MQIFLFFYSILAFLLPITTKKSVPRFTTRHTFEKIYSKSTYDRTTPITPDEAAARLRFSTVAAMIKQRKGDLTKIAADQQAFLEQKDLPNGKKTMKAWYWKVCGDQYDQNLANG